MTCPPELLAGGDHPITDVPREVAECPECGDQLEIDVYEWESETGFPTTTGFHVVCKSEEMSETGVPVETHRCWQSDWQPINDSIAEWLEAVEA
ncbi:MAG: hypothetical protein H8E44_00145 [Planctomycetes bacterium]|nr:hypothetical protein [Planctomycetota bacterium]